MRIAVLAAADSWYLADLRRAAGARHELTAIDFRDLTSSLKKRGRESFPGSVGDVINQTEWKRLPTPFFPPADVAISARGVDLHGFDAVLVRAMPPGSLEQVVFRMDLLGRLEAAGVPVVNPPRAIEAAVDKYLASARIAAAGLPTPRTIVCQTVEEGLAAFAALGGDVVLKPLFGSEGRGMARLQDEALAERAFRLLVPLGSVLYVQQFISHDGFDIRVLVVGEQLFAIRRRHPGDWRTNLSRGATAEPIELTAEMADLARRAADALGAPLAGVDLLPGCDGGLYVLEVNAVPGWKGLAGALGVDVAAAVLAYMESASQRVH